MDIVEAGNEVACARMIAHQPSVAMCYSGEFRTLDIVHDGVRAATERLANNMVTFMFLTASPAASPCRSSTGCSRTRSLSRREGSNWTDIHDEAVRNTVKRYSMWQCAVVASYRPSPTGYTEHLCRGKDKAQYWKLQQVFLQVKRYEVRSRAGRQFDWLVRMRTDVWFLAPLPPLWSLNATQVHVPHGMVTRTVPMNDHFAIVPRHLASSYFDAANDLSCKTRKLRGFNDKAFLRDRLRRTAVSVNKLEIGYVLLRSGIGAACWRLKTHLRTRQWWQACLNLSTAMPVHCITSDGKGHPRSSLALERLHARLHNVLAISDAPRCSELPTSGWTRQVAEYAAHDWPPAVQLF